MKNVELLGLSVSPWIIIPMAYFLWVTVLLLVKRVSFKYLQRFAKKSKTHLDDIIAESADLPSTLLIFASGVVVIERWLPNAGDASLTTFVVIAFKVTSIVAIVLFVDRLINGLMKQYANKVDVLRSSGGVVRGFVRMIVIGLGVLILLDSFGVSITPILASLGIGSLAIALALQPTLESLFAGIQIIVDKPFKVGQFIKLESGEEGYVHKIGWRSTWVRMLPNNMVVMPNKTMVNSKVINYYYPETEMAVLVQVGVHYESDLEQVERVTIDVARETLKEVAGGVAEFDPFIRYHTFSDFSINFTVILRAHEFVDNYLIKHEFIKRLHKRYAQENINIPYPIRAVNFDQEKAFSGQELSVKSDPQTRK